jgi:hypothetical protein
MSSENHEKAVFIVRERIEKEYEKQRVSVVTGTKVSKGYIPDIVVIFPDRKMLVIEVGYTRPAKIVKYLNDESISQIRWYDKTPSLLGMWDKTSSTTNEVLHIASGDAELAEKYFSLQDNVTKMKTKTVQLRREKMKINSVLNLDNIAICPFCLHRFKLRNGKIHNWNKGDSIISCDKCSPSLSASELDELPGLLTTYKQSKLSRDLKQLERTGLGLQLTQMLNL